MGIYVFLHVNVDLWLGGKACGALDKRRSKEKEQYMRLPAYNYRAGVDAGLRRCLHSGLFCPGTTQHGWSALRTPHHFPKVTFCS